MRLLRSEFLRARSRRLVWMVLAGGVVGIVVALTIAAFHSTSPSQAVLDQAQAQYDKDLQRCMSGRFLESNGELPPGYDTLSSFCEDNVGVSLTDAGAWLHDLPEILRGISMFVILLGAWLGASLAGADWTSNTMTTLLTWEPRRGRVLAVRALVVAVVVLATTLVLQAVFTAGFTVVANLFGTTAFSPSDLWRDVASTVGLVSAMGVAVGLVAYAVAMVGRSTVSSLGALFGYLVLFEGVIAGFRPSIQPYLLVRAATVVVSQNPIYDNLEPRRILLGVGGAWITVAAYVVGLLTVAFVVFRRRDVT